MDERNRVALRWTAITMLVWLSLFGSACGSMRTVEPAGVEAMVPGKDGEGSYAADLKSKLNHIIERRLNETEAIRVLDVFPITDYNIQDKETFWGHRAVAGSGGPYSEYYFTYRKKHFILFLHDKDAVNHLCLDLRMIDKTREEYELNAGKVEVDGRAVDEEVIVLVKRTWSGEYTTDILAAFKPVVSTGKIETLKYKTIRIYRED